MDTSSKRVIGLLAFALGFLIAVCSCESVHADEITDEDIILFADCAAVNSIIAARQDPELGRVTEAVGRYYVDAIVMLLDNDKALAWEVIKARIIVYRDYYNSGQMEWNTIVDIFFGCAKAI